jgi:CRP-like cAMP-binding protein
VVGNTLRLLQGTPEATPKPSPSSPSSEAVTLIKILTERTINESEDLEQLSFWAISQIEVLKGLNRQQKQQLRGLGRVEHYDPDVVIFSEATDARKLYVVEEGRVAVESQVARGMRFPISVVYPGQAFGWSALVQPYVYTATVIALSRTRVVAIEREALLSMMRGDPSLGFTIMQNVASIVASRLRTVELALAGLLQQGR